MEAQTQIIIPKNEENNHIRDEHFHVLAVDDSIIERKMLEKLLTISSYHVTCVESGDKALEYLGLVNCHSPVIDDDGHVHDDDHHDHVDDHHDDGNDDDDVEVSMICPSLPLPDNVHHHHHQGQGTRVNLIMTDYSMPGITGYDLLKRVKESSWKDVPVVVMSSENVPSRIHMCLEEGAEEFLLKPVRLSDLKKLQPRVFKATPSTSSESEENNKKSNFLAANDNKISKEEIIKIIADHREDYTSNSNEDETNKISYEIEKFVEISKMNL
ncbi:two-component response regulator ORR9-like isoform X2 [Chenopodium quinoa]|uniref:two-component response regulator ORR9-like isoform X2 n=1 Tax=Chenopodium quinoa TaxID=63459 RepID=UPI000B77B561|nr:two-component response regulator ORR9-like isoform X2 [Chenopodium quinoa]